MARTRDRTEDFREAVRIIASKQGFDKVKMAKISESLILRRPQQKSPFTQSALKILESIRTLQNFIVNHKKDYMDRHRTTEQDRDNIEHEVGVFVKACREQIENLKNSIESKERKKQTVTWLGVQGDAANAEDIAHKHGVVLILSEQLHSITSFFDQLRAERFREVIDRTMPRRMQHVESKFNSSETSISNDPKDTEVSQQNHQAETKGIQQQLLDEETQTLQIELTNLIDTVQETERKMLEMSALNHLFSTHVLHQAQQIERLYEQAVEATANVKEGNKELTKAIERNSSSRVLLLLILVVLPLTLLFLDWYADWKKAKTYKKNHEIFEGKVEGSNSGGVLVRFYSLQGFLPYSQMSPSHLLKVGTKVLSEVGKDLIGSTLSLKVIEVSEQEETLIFSEKQAMWEKFSIKVGDVFEGKVSSVTRFGAFVELRFPDGGYYVDGLVHISEVSWDLVRDVRDILKKGDGVRVKVVQIDVEKSRLAFSIKQLQADPLFETLDTLMPQEGALNTGTSTAGDLAPSEPLPDLEQICEELLREKGITNVTIGRQVLEKRVVSQDLELWLSNMPVEGGKFTLLARAGRLVQELHLETSLDRAGIKQAVQRVMGRVL